MTVKRIVANVVRGSVPEVRGFYADLFGLKTVMDRGWIVTLASGETMLAQLSIVCEGGFGSAVSPDLSIEVDDVDEVYSKAQRMGCDIVYALRDEPWGVRRFFVRDPAGTLVNVLSHIERPAAAPKAGGSA